MEGSSCVACPGPLERLTLVTPPLTDERPFPQAARVLRLFRSRKDGRPVTDKPWLRLQLVPGEYEEIQRRTEQNESLQSYVEDKIRYTYQIGEEYRIGC